MGGGDPHSSIVQKSLDPPDTQLVAYQNITLHVCAKFMAVSSTLKFPSRLRFYIMFSHYFHFIEHKTKKNFILHGKFSLVACPKVGVRANDLCITRPDTLTIGNTLLRLNNRVFTF